MYEKQKKHRATAVWQKWRFSSPHQHFWLIQNWFSASTFEIKSPPSPSPKPSGCEKTIIRLLLVAYSTHFKAFNAYLFLSCFGKIGFIGLA